jgi:putative flippase GtrA
MMGLIYFQKHLMDSSSGVILVDMDQGFTLLDIQTVADAMINIPDAVIVGGRGVSGKSAKYSSFISSQFSKLIGAQVEDFNSGLRGLPVSFVRDLLSQQYIKTDFWLEMFVLAGKTQTQIVEVPIHSQHNSKSPILINFIFNSTRFVYIFLRFSFLSMITAGIDYAIFSFLVYLSNSIFLSILIARIVAGSFQFIMGKKWVFKSKSRFIGELIKYILLVGILMLVSYTFIELMVTNFGMNTIVSKLIAELSLFIISFTVQKKVIFSHPADSKK